MRERIRFNTPFTDLNYPSAHRGAMPRNTEADEIIARVFSLPEPDKPKRIEHVRGLSARVQERNRARLSEAPQMTVAPLLPSSTLDSGKIDPELLFTERFEDLEEEQPEEVSQQPTATQEDDSSDLHEEPEPVATESIKSVEVVNLIPASVLYDEKGLKRRLASPNHEDFVTIDGVVYLRNS
jgi:hypothetical protein